MQFRNTFQFYSTLFLISIMWFACGDDNSTQQNTESNTIKVETPTPPKVVSTAEASLDKPAEDSGEKVSEKIMEEPTPTKIDAVKKEEKPVVKKEKPKPKKRAKMHFPEKVYEYGFVMQGDTVTHDFYFKNVGNDDLMIKRVEASCGCTTPSYPREPIPPGEDGKISVVFKTAGKLGRQIPHINVYTNYKRRIKLELKGFVDAERAKPPQVIEEKENIN